MQREYVDLIKVSADALLGVIEDILDFSKIEAGMLQVDPITVEVEQVFGDAVKAMALRAHQKGLELVYHVSPDVPEYIVARSRCGCGRCVTNLLGNAIKFTERGEVSLERGRRARSAAASVDAARAREGHGHRHPARQAGTDLRAVRAGRRIHHAASTAAPGWA